MYFNARISNNIKILQACNIENSIAPRTPHATYYKIDNNENKEPSIYCTRVNKSVFWMCFVLS